VREPIVQMLQRFFWSGLWLKSLPDLCSTCCIQWGESGSAMKRPRARNRGQNAVWGIILQLKSQSSSHLQSHKEADVQAENITRCGSVSWHLTWSETQWSRGTPSSQGQGSALSKSVCQSGTLSSSSAVLAFDSGPLTMGRVLSPSCSANDPFLLS